MVTAVIPKTARIDKLETINPTLIDFNFIIIPPNNLPLTTYNHTITITL